MDPTRYARPERERRFLLAAVPEGAIGGALIRDRYIIGTRLRLRIVGEGPEAERKLGHKVRPDPANAALVLHTSLYLSSAEWDVLVGLPAAELVKRRSSLPLAGGRRLSVDAFTGPLAGLVLAEIELADEAAFAAFEPPTSSIREVTGDERFTGAALARSRRADVRAAVADVIGAAAADRLIGPP